MQIATTHTFNTGNAYGPEGQIIVAVQFTDGTIAFHDATRGIRGMLADHGRPNEPATFRDLDASREDHLRRLEHWIVRDYMEAYPGSRTCDIRDLPRKRAMREAVKVVNSRRRLARQANDATTHLPRLNGASTREALVAWLCQNDRCGVYSDEDMVAEGWEPMTISDAWNQIDHAINGSCDACGEPARFERYDGHGPTENACDECATDAAQWERI